MDSGRFLPVTNPEILRGEVAEDNIGYVVCGVNPLEINPPEITPRRKLGMYRTAIFRIRPEPGYPNTCCIAISFGFVCGMNKKVLFPVLVVFSVV